MEKENKIILGVALLFTIITSVPTLLSGFGMIFVNSNLTKGLYQFFLSMSLWIILVAGIIFVLYKMNKKANQSIFEIIEDRTIRIASGILVSIEGLTNLGRLLPTSIKNLILLLEISKQAGFYADSTIVKSILANFISLILVLCQILFGIYLVRYRKNQNKEV